MVITRLQGWLEARPPWQRWALAMASGLGVSLAMPPVYAVPMLLAALPVFALLIEASNGLRARVATGWWFGAGYMLSSLYWVSNALEIAGAPPVLAVFLPLSMAFYYALLAVLYGALRSRTKSRVALFAGCWLVAEFLRGHLFTGFPWNLLGYVWSFSDAMPQVASLIGIYGLSLLTALVAASPLAMARARPEWPLFRRAAPVLAGLVLCAGLFVYGVVRLSSADTLGFTDTRLRIVQANIAQEDKWRPELRVDNFIKYLRMSAREGIEKTDLLIWPEVAIPYFLEEDPGRTVMIGRAVRPGGLVLTGALRRDLGPGGAPRYYNSFFVVDHSGAVQARYDKAHLVPFGEYVPFYGALAWLGIEKVVEGAGDYTPGAGPRVLALPGAPAVSPLICYEAIFPGAVLPGRQRADWLLNVTNDAWYGVTAGPYQHLMITRLRAIEEGLPMVRSAGTGISAIIDAYGRVLRRLDLGQSGIIDGLLPQRLGQPTLYGRLGDGMLLVLAVVILGARMLIQRYAWP